MRALGHVIAASLLCTVFGGVAFFWHYVREYKSADNDSHERLKLLQRVRYLTQRFTRNGKSWQFVVWGRQVSLIHSRFIHNLLEVTRVTPSSILMCHRCCCSWYRCCLTLSTTPPTRALTAPCPTLGQSSLASFFSHSFCFSAAGSPTAS